MEQYFTSQLKDLASTGPPQKLYFMVETELGPDPHGPGMNIKIEVLNIHTDEITTLGDTYLFVRHSDGIIPVFRRK